MVDISVKGANSWLMFIMTKLSMLLTVQHEMFELIIVVKDRLRYKLCFLNEQKNKCNMKKNYESNVQVYFLCLYLHFSHLYFHVNKFVCDIKEILVCMNQRSVQFEGKISSCRTCA